MLTSELGGHQKQKIFFTFSDLARGRISLKWKRKFFVSGVLPSRSRAGLQKNILTIKIVTNYGFCLGIA